MGLFDDVMDLGGDFLDVADDVTFGVARKVTPNVIRKPIDGEELTAGDVVEDAAAAILVPAGIDELLGS
jgi:hypothetical protein